MLLKFPEDEPVIYSLMLVELTYDYPKGSLHLVILLAALVVKIHSFVRPT